MDAKELAQKLNGREYLREITKDEASAAKIAGLVVAFGASDDLMELRGAVDDELDACKGGVAYFNQTGLLRNECREDRCPHFEKLRALATPLTAVWGEGGYSWIFEASFPHETFDVMEDGTKFCRGIVFALADLPAI